MKDMMGFDFQVGCKVVRAISRNRSAFLMISVVTKIMDQKLYLDNSPQPMHFPQRLLIIDQDPLYRMVKIYDHENK